MGQGVGPQALRRSPGAHHRLAVNIATVQLHSPEQVEGYVDEALRILSHTEVADDLRVAVFVQVFQALAARQVMPVAEPLDGRGILAGIRP